MNTKYFIIVGLIIIGQSTLVKPNDLAEADKLLRAQSSATEKFVVENLSFLEEKILGQDCPKYLALFEDDQHRWLTSLAEGDELYRKLFYCWRLSYAVMPMLPTGERKEKVEIFRKNAGRALIPAHSRDRPRPDLTPQLLEELIQDSKQ
jgi:hypothetical protein